MPLSHELHIVEAAAISLMGASLVALGFLFLLRRERFGAAPPLLLAGAGLAAAAWKGTFFLGLSEDIHGFIEAFETVFFVLLTTSVVTWGASILQRHAEHLHRQILRSQEADTQLAKRAAELALSNAQLEQFAYAASHQLQEPLRSITSFAQLLRLRYAGRLDADADEIIRLMVDGGKSMQSVLLGLVECARVGRVELVRRPVDTGLLVDGVVERLGGLLTTRRAKVKRGPLPVAEADEALLTLVFRHLIDNAVRYSKGDGFALVEVSATLEGAHWRFTVADNGAGIDPSFLPDLFRLFRRLAVGGEPAGAGAGLAVCRLAVERHGGRIWAESRFGAGSSIHFTLPAASGLAAEGGPSRGSALRDRSTKGATFARAS